MRHTIVGVFDRHAAAAEAARSLQAAGFQDVRITDAVDDDAGRADRPADNGVVAHIRSFFAELFGPGDDITSYAHAVHDGGAVVRAGADDERQLASARQLLQGAGAVSIEERAAT